MGILQQITSPVQSGFEAALAAPIAPHPRWDVAPWPEAPGFVPTAEDEAYWAAFTLALEGPELALAPAEMDVWLQLDFYSGWADGMHARWKAEDDERREYDAWLDQLAAERTEEAFGDEGRVTDADMYRAGGVS